MWGHLTIRGIGYTSHPHTDKENGAPRGLITSPAPQAHPEQQKAWLHHSALPSSPARALARVTGTIVVT